MRAYRGSEGLRRRVCEIRALPKKVWKGNTVYRTLCDADYGKGEHEMWFPASKLLVLLDVTRMRCPWHS